MKLYKAAPIALAVAAVLGASTAFAENRDDDQRQAAAIASARVSLSDAIAAAEANAKGTPFEAGLEEEDNKLIYEIKFADKDGKVSRVFLDPGGGKIVETSPEGLMERAYKTVFDGDDKRQLDTVRTAKVDLNRAVSLAEQTSGGRAFDARVENENGKVVYEVELASNGGSEAVSVDPQSGQVIQLADEESEQGERGEHEREGERERDD